MALLPSLQRINSGTFFALLFFQDNKSLHFKRSSLRVVIAFYLSQQFANRFYLYNLHCIMEFVSKYYVSLKYYFLKTLYAFFHNLSFFAYGTRVIFFRFEALLNKLFLEDFTIDLFCYDKLSLTPSTIIPFNRYLLRLDMYSFFFLWSGMEGVRVSFYNNYLKAHPGLWERPYLRHSLNQSWFPRRWCYVPLRGYKILHLVEFDYRGIRQVLHERFSIMFNYRKYIILNLVRASTLYFKQLPLSSEAKWILRKDATVYWLGALSNPTSFKLMALGFFSPWNWPQCCRLFFSYFMEYPKRYHLDKWRITRYYYYYVHAIDVVPDTADNFLNKSIRDYSIKFTKKFYGRLFASNFLQCAFFFEDLYHYSNFRWDIFGSFIDRHFCYRVFLMKFNWFFDNYFLETFSPYTSVTLNLQRPFRRKDSPTYALPRKRALSFAKRFLLRFCNLPIYFSYILLGLEYYYWRIYELDAAYRWLHNILPLTYYYVKLDIDKLLVSRYRVMVSFFRTFIKEHHFSVYRDSYWTYYNLNDAAFMRNRWSEAWRVYFFDPWILFHFSALKSIFLQSFNHNISLTLVGFYLISVFVSNSMNLNLSLMFLKRIRTCLLSVEVFHNYIYADRLTFRRLPVDWEASRAKKWLFSFDEKSISKISIDERYAINYQWRLENIQTQFLD